MSDTIEITAVLNAHGEGVLAGPSRISFEQAIAAARAAGLTVEALVVLDRADAATRRQFADLDPASLGGAGPNVAGPQGACRVIQTDTGDPGLARNAAVTAARGRFVAFLDGDDLWSRNWLVAAHRFCAPDPEAVVAHPELDMIFGQLRAMWWHVDSRDPGFDPDLLRISNYWDAMSFAARAIYRRFPFVKNNLARGFGHEDWHWNCVTLAAGIHHCPVPGTVHFKRRRRNSQLALCDAIDAIPWITPIASYAYPPQPD